jgi:phosphate transport system substrate-binding protein
MNTKFVAFTAAAAVAGAMAVQPAAARDQLQIVGSSTVYPYAQAVSEEFANETGNPAPVLESTGSGGGMEIFCQGVGADHPDITNASRAMKASEYDLCQENGVESITEVLIGFDGLSLAVSREGADLDLTKTQIFKALSKQVPVDGELVDNPYTNWSDIDPSLPDAEILIYGPPPTSGTRDAFVELVMAEGCAELDFYDGMDTEEVCAPMRTDGPFVEAGENDNLIVQRLEADASAMGIFGYSFLFENQDKLKAVSVNGVEPSAATIESGDYGVSRPLFFYIKNAHRDVIPGMQDYIAEFVSEEAFGPDGYLKERGLVPLGDERRAEVREAALEGTPMEPKE